MQRRWEKHAQEPGVKTDEVSEGAEDESVAATSSTKRAGEAAMIQGIGEVLQLPGERITVEEGEGREGRASENPRTAMKGIKMGGEEMDEGEEAEVKRDVGEAKYGVLEGGAGAFTGSHRATASGCRDRRHSPC